MVRLFCFAALILLTRSAATGERSPIADAAEGRHWEAVRRQLLEEGDPTRPQIDGMTALHWAVDHGNLQAVAQLLIAGAEPNAVNRYGVTPLSISAQHGASGITRRLLIAGGGPQRLDSRRGRPAYPSS